MSLIIQCNDVDMRSTAERKAWFTESTFSNVFKLNDATDKKDASVETLRGLAIILVVTGHMIGYSETGGMRVSEDSFLRYLYYSLEYIRLPLFTVISGWVYANKPVEHEFRDKFIAGKFRRLLIPMFILSTLLFLLRMIIPGTNSTPELTDLPRNLVTPYDLYWYLYSLFLIFIIISVLDTQPRFRNLAVWLVTLVFAFLILFVSETFLDPVPNFLSFKGAAYLLPFFLIGIGIYRYRDLLLSGRMTTLLLVIFGISIVIQQTAWFGYLPMQERHSLLGMTVGISGVLLLFRLGMKNALLVWIGGYAYGIFLFHVFFTGGSRIILAKAGVHNQAVVLALGVAFAIFMSMLLEVLVRKSPIFRFYILGLKKKEKQLSKKG